MGEVIKLVTHINTKTRAENEAEAYDEASVLFTYIDEPNPTTRLLITQMQTSQLDMELELIRARRLTVVAKLEVLAQAKADKTQFADYLRFEGAFNRAMAALKKTDDQLAKAEALVQKARLAALQAGI